MGPQGAYWIMKTSSFTTFLIFFYVICIFYCIPLLLLVWILVQQIQITIRLKNKIILLCIEINLKTYKIYPLLFYTREFLTITVHVYTQSYSCSTILSHNHIIKKLAVSATLFHTSFHSHSHIFLLFFLIHTISLLHFFLTFYTIIDILFCSIYSKTFLHALFSYLPPLLLYQIYNNFQFILSIHKTNKQKTKHRENININIKAIYCLNWSMNNCITIIMLKKNKKMLKKTPIIYFNHVLYES